MWKIITARSPVASITFHFHRRHPVHAFIVQMWWPAVSKCEYWILITVLKLKMHTMSCPQRDLIMTKCDYIKISSITVLQKYVSQTFTTVCTIAFMLKNMRAQHGEWNKIIVSISSYNSNVCFMSSKCQKIELSSVFFEVVVCAA